MGTVKFPEGMDASTTIAGDDKLMIAKATTGEAMQATFDSAKQYLNITGIEVKAVAGGATEATAVVLSPGPDGQDRKMGGVTGWFKNATGAAWLAPSTSNNYNWWDGTAKVWSLGSSVPLPVGSADGIVAEGETKAPNGDKVYKSTLPLFNNIKVINETEDIKNQLNILSGWLRVDGSISVTSSEQYFDYFPVKSGDKLVITNFGNTDTARTNLVMYNTSKVFVSNFGGNYGKTPNSDGSYTNTYNITQDGFVRGGANAAGGWISVIGTLKKEVKYYATPEDISNLSIGTNNLVDFAVTASKTDMFYTNLVAASDFQDGYYVNNTNGQLFPNSSYSATSPLIPIVPGKKYIKANTNQHWAIFNKNGTFVRGGTATNVIIAGVGEYFAKVTATPSTKDSFMLIEGDVLPSSYLKKGDYKLKSSYMGELVPFQPRLATPRKIYVLNNQENSIYHKSYVERILPNFFVNGSGTGWTYRKRYFRTSGNASNLTINLNDTISTLAISSKTIGVSSYTANTPETPLTINVWGDSYTHNGTWYGYTSNYLNALTFVGIRTSYAVTVKGEGRSGWTLSTYFTNYKTVNLFSPLMHPSGNTYKYYGPTGFWKQVVAGNTDPNFIGFTDRVSQFNTSGFLASPQTNDLMYDTDALMFKSYNGTTWVDVSESSLTFEVNYAKYLSVWNITTPNVFVINLGMNDFSGTMPTDSTFSLWKSRMEMIITSVKSAVPTIKIGVCIHNSVFASDNNTSNVNPILQSANLWEGRRRVLESFDTTTWESQGVFIVDTGSAHDSDYGWDQTDELPFVGYTGTAKEILTSNSPHPSTVGYRQLSVRFAGFLQMLRTLV